LNHYQQGWWSPSETSPGQGKISYNEALRLIRQPLYMIRTSGTLEAKTDGTVHFGGKKTDNGAFALAGYAPPCPVEQLGDPQFCTDHGMRYPYLAGSMAKGISSVAMVEAMAHDGMLGFFGAAGLPLAAVEAAIERLSANAATFAYGFNLIHSPQERDLENALVDLYIRKGIRLVEASAFLELTLPVVRYRLHGIHRDPSGAIVTPNRIIAKISREEVAARFMAPPAERLLRQLLAAGDITAEQAELAGQIPVAQDITAEADSGGHTDNRPALALFPTICALRDRLQEQYRYGQRLRVGLAGGISTPLSAAAAFAMGAAYIMTGTVNQACVESDTSDEARLMLAETRQADVAMAPAADMFEMGVTVQVLKRGTMFPMRAEKLYELYRSCAGIAAIPQAEREKLEKTVFRSPLEEIWRDTRAYFLKRDPQQLERAERDEKHRLALVFRWYLGQAAHWAKDGESSRRIDYQVWCGPAMGAFNEWATGSFLETPANRRVVTVALNILHGAAVIMRSNTLHNQGVRFSPELSPAPLEFAQIKEYLS
jgi:trans-AT polyketide synthase/acyltransferase/oxidoreductase domain-containing protein